MRCIETLVTIIAVQVIRKLGGTVSYPIVLYAVWIILLVGKLLPGWRREVLESVDPWAFVLIVCELLITLLLHHWTLTSFRRLLLALLIDLVLVLVDTISVLIFIGDWSIIVIYIRVVIIGLDLRIMGAS
jgi:hypothetical protein